MKDKGIQAVSFLFDSRSSTYSNTQNQNTHIHVHTTILKNYAQKAKQNRESWMKTIM